MYYHDTDNERIYDNHTLYVVSKSSDIDDVRTYFQSIFAIISSVTGKIDETLVINRVERKNGEPLGFSYVRVSSDVYNVIIGRNVDGSERVKITIEEDSDDDFDFSSDIAWGDIEPSRREVREKLGPLVEIPYTIDVLNKDGTIDREINMEFGPAFVQKLDNKHDRSVLFIKKVPDSITADQIYQVFKPYVTKQNAKFVTGPKSNRISLSYPSVKFTRSKDRFCFIEFDSSTYDAQFALLMLMKLKFGTQLLIVSQALTKR
jgi:hypothetical protein